MAAIKATTRSVEMPCPTGDDPEDRVLFERFLRGDDLAFGELYRRHNPRLHRYAARMLGSPHDAEDVTQEMWGRLIRRRAEERGEIDHPLGMLVRVARNLCIDRLRRRQRLVTTDDPDLLEPPPPLADDPLLDEAVAALDRLPYDYREVLVLNIYSGYRFDEIATMLGTTPEAIWTRASRARRALRRLVAEGLAHSSNDEGP